MKNVFHIIFCVFHICWRFSVIDAYGMCCLELWKYVQACQYLCLVQMLFQLLSFSLNQRQHSPLDSVSFNSHIIFYSTIFFNLNVNTETGQFSNTASKFYDNASCVLNYIYTCLFIQTCKAKLNDKTNYYIPR
jgi:hypothetical protein